MVVICFAPPVYLLTYRQAGLQAYAAQFMDKPLFQELPPSVFQVIEDFKTAYPKFLIPDKFSRVAGLNARIKDRLHFQTSSPVTKKSTTSLILLDFKLF